MPDDPTTTRNPTTPGWGAARAALAGTLVTAATVAAASYGGPEAGAAAGTLTAKILVPLLSGLLLGAGAFFRKVMADAKHVSGAGT